jgi:hypothetical protein
MCLIVMKQIDSFKHCSCHMCLFNNICFAPIVCIFLSTTAQLAAIQRKVEGEKETLEQQQGKVSPGM